MDCGKLISDYPLRCSRCAIKITALKLRKPIPNRYCEICNKKINFRTKSNRCRVCVRIGFKHTPQSKEKLREAMLGRIVTWGWKISKGKTFLTDEEREYGSEFDSSLREQVRFRDGYKCQVCGMSQLENGRQLDCHHIDYNKRNNILSNLIALCRSCHTGTNHKREYWTNYFHSLIKEKINV